MKKSISIFMIALMAVFGASLFADEMKIVVGINPAQDMVRSADSERAIKRLEAQISAALLKVKKFTVAKREGKEDLKDVDYLLDISMIEYSEETMNVKKMMQKNAKYAVEIKLLKVSNNHIIIQDTIKGTYAGEKVPMMGAVPDVYSLAMEEVSGKITDTITAELFPISVLKVSEGGIITLPNYGFEIGQVLNVFRVEALTDADGNEVARENILVCPIVILEISGSTARALIHTLKPYKSKYAKAVVEAGMICKRAEDKTLDAKTIAPLQKALKKAK